MKRSLPIAVALVLALITVALAAFSFSAGQRLTGVLLVIAALAAAYGGVLEIRRRDAAEISQRALADWPPERVRSTIGRIDGEVARVRTLRKADPRLTLADAAALAKQSGA